MCPKLEPGDAGAVAKTVQAWLGNPISRGLIKFVSGTGKNGNRLDLGLKKRIRKGFGAELAEFLGAKESYVNVSFNNLLFFLHRNTWFYFSTDDEKLYGLGTNYLPMIGTGYTIKF